MKRTFGKRLWFEVLEDRTVPALLLQLDGVGNLTGIFGVPDGDVTLTMTADDEINVNEDGNDLGTYSVPGNLTVSLGNVAAATLVDVIMDDAAFSGSMSVTLGNALGGYSFSIDGGAGSAGSIGGNLTVRTGSGPDLVDIGADFDSGAGGMSIGGNLTVDTGADDDSFFINDLTIIQGTVRGTNVNQFELFDSAVAGEGALIEGHLYLTASEVVNNNFFLDGNNLGGSSRVEGNVIIKGVNGPAAGPSDTVDVQCDVLGSVIAKMGNGANTVTINSTAVIAGNVVVTGGNATDIISLDSTGAGDGAVVLGSVTVNAKNGSNVFTVDTDSVVLGPQITYIGGNNDDEVTFDGTAIGARFTALLAAGIDTLNLGSNLLASLYVDFGSGVDDLVLGPGIIINVPTTFRNLP
jgi:hypothetical protein